MNWPVLKLVQTKHNCKYRVNCVLKFQVAIRVHMSGRPYRCDCNGRVFFVLYPFDVNDLKQHVRALINLLYFRVKGLPLIQDLILLLFRLKFDIFNIMIQMVNNFVINKFV